MSVSPLPSKSSWPWMKDVDFALIETPIDPIDEYDERPAVRDLIKQKRAKIDKIRAEVQSDPLFDETKHDDLWLLRFVLSHKKSKESIDAVRECLAYRKKYNLDEADIRKTDPDEGPCKKFRDACDGVPSAKLIPDPKRGEIGIFFYRNINQQRLLDELSDEELLLAIVRTSEWTFQNLDYVTRTTGRLTKAVRLMDCEGFSMDRLRIDQFRREGECLGVTSNCYPQISDSIFFCNAPGWARIPWRILRPIAPKSIVSKVDFINPKDKKKDLLRLLPYVSEENLPVEFGGKCKLDLESCDQEEEVVEEEEEEKVTKITNQTSYTPGKVAI